MVKTIRPYGPGKFDTVLDSLVYSSSLDGCDEETGSVKEGCWHGVLRGAIDPSELRAPVLTDGERDLLKESQGGVILTEDSQGFVEVEYFKTVDELAAVWSEYEREHQRRRAAGSRPNPHPETGGEDETDRPSA